MATRKIRLVKDAISSIPIEGYKNTVKETLIFPKGTILEFEEVEEERKDDERDIDFRQTKDYYGVYDCLKRGFDVHIPSSKQKEVGRFVAQLIQDGDHMKGKMVFYHPHTRNPQKEPEPKERWRPKKDEEYFYIIDNNEGVNSFSWEDKSFDRACFFYYNCFRTKELAEKARLAVLETLKTFHLNNQ